MIPAPDRLVAALQGRYAVGPTLGAGVMAAVYRARDEKHGRDVALKVLHSRYRVPPCVPSPS